jgi:hypothetical protein
MDVLAALDFDGVRARWVLRVVRPHHVKLENVDWMTFSGAGLDVGATTGEMRCDEILARGVLGIAGELSHGAQSIRASARRGTPRDAEESRSRLSTIEAKVKFGLNAVPASWRSGYIASFPPDPRAECHSPRSIDLKIACSSRSRFAVIAFRSFRSVEPRIKRVSIRRTLASAICAHFCAPPPWNLLCLV